MRRTGPLIVGGGPAGAAAAITLARNGARPLLIERTEGPHDVVCGGFLGQDALSALTRLGIDVDTLGAHPIRRVRLVSDRKKVEVLLPWAAAGLSRRTLDDALLKAAVAAGADMLRGRAVRAIEAAARTVRLDDREEVEAETLFLATGKHDIRGSARDTSGRKEAPAVGLRCSLQASPELEAALAGTVELHLFDGGYAGLLLQEDGQVNLCISVEQAKLRTFGSVEALIVALKQSEPILGERIADAAGVNWAAVAGVPYGWRATGTEAGLYRLGDQAAVIASLAGDGVAIALSSGIEAAGAMLLSGSGGAESYQKSFASRSAFPLATADALRWSAERARPRRILMRLLGRMPWLAPHAIRLTRIDR